MRARWTGAEDAFTSVCTGTVTLEKHEITTATEHHLGLPNLTRNIWPAAHEAEAGLCSVFSRAPPFLLLVSTAPTEEINRNTDPFSPLLSASGLLEPRPPRWTLKRTRTRREIKSRIRNTSLEKDISCSTRRYPKEMRICYEIGIIATERYPLKMTD